MSMMTTDNFCFYLQNRLINQEVNSTVILPPLVFPARRIWGISGEWISSTLAMNEYMGNVYTVHGQCMGSAWEVHGQCMFSAWAVHGQCMHSAWAVHG